MEKIALTIEDNTGTAKIEWIAENQYSMAHYAAFISVPYQNSRWENLFVYDKNKLPVAKEKAKQYLEMALLRCALCG